MSFADDLKKIEDGFDEPLATVEEAREFVRNFEETAQDLKLSDDQLVHTLKQVAEAYDHVRGLRNHSRALRERVSEIARKKGL